MNDLDLFRNKHAQALRRLFTERYLVAGALTDEHHPDLLNKKASDEVVMPFFKEAFAKYGIYNTLSKESLYLLAASMQPEEIQQTRGACSMTSRRPCPERATNAPERMPGHSELRGREFPGTVRR